MRGTPAPTLPAAPRSSLPAELLQHRLERARVVELLRLPFAHRPAQVACSHLELEVLHRRRAAHALEAAVRVDDLCLVAHMLFELGLVHVLQGVAALTG